MTSSNIFSSYATPGCSLVTQFSQIGFKDCLSFCPSVCLQRTLFSFTTRQETLRCVSIESSTEEDDKGMRSIATCLCFATTTIRNSQGVFMSKKEGGGEQCLSNVHTEQMKWRISFWALKTLCRITSQCGHATAAEWLELSQSDTVRCSFDTYPFLLSVCYFATAADHLHAPLHIQSHPV